MQPPAAASKRKAFFTRRTGGLLIALLLFMPPLSLLFQFTQDSNFCGTWCPRMFFVWRQGQDLPGFLLGWLRAYMGVLLVLGMLLATFFLGRIWCGHVCPIGGATELGSRLVPARFKLNLQALPAAPIRYGYLSAYLLLPVFGLGSLCCAYCNFATVPRLSGAVFSQADMAFFLRTAGLIDLALLAGLGFFVKGGRGYCNLLCPVGALDALSNRLGQHFGKRTRIREEDCTACGRCRAVCPVWAIELADKSRIDQLNCISCRLCISVCPAGAITHGKRATQRIPEADDATSLG